MKNPDEKPKKDVAGEPIKRAKVRVLYPDRSSLPFSTPSAKSLDEIKANWRGILCVSFCLLIIIGIIISVNDIQQECKKKDLCGLLLTVKNATWSDEGYRKASTCCLLEGRWD